MRISLGSDHAGFELKEQVKKLLEGLNHQVQDEGTESADSVDYPDFASRVAGAVSEGGADRGILICGSGIGMSITANKVLGIRAALCHTPEEARLSRQHNDANVLTLGGRVLDGKRSLEIVGEWLTTTFEGGRHGRRVRKIEELEQKTPKIRHSSSVIRNSKFEIRNSTLEQPLQEVDSEVAQAIDLETGRQSETLELIASENFVSEAVLEAAGSVFTNKYAEGYPGRRYYGGCQNVDTVESLAIERAKKLFGAEHANVQPHSGSQANMAAYLAVLEHGDKVLGMNLSHGGHLTHGHPLNFSGKFFDIVPYGVTKDSEEIDYDALEALAQREKPKMIVAGASAYSRVIHFDRISEIAKRVGAYLMADIAHIAGLIVAGLHPSPIPYADFVTTTTHKTLRGPRGGMVMCKEEHKKALDKIVLPGIQGGPLVHIIAAKAVCLREAMSDEFHAYQGRIVKNASALARSIQDQGFRIVSGGTDTHLFLVDVFSRSITGKQAEEALEKASITVNKNAIPFDTQPPLVGSGIRVGTPALTTRGMGKEEMIQIGDWMGRVLNNIGTHTVQQEVKREAQELTRRFPLYAYRLL